ncbi:hypothetical protein NOM01_04415 [Sporolactobacillus sp. STSJ-5]|uniref:Cas9 inhibitor AcrIIA9 family protein n=1 Tax=Sporolactobacillus sp. STSJ-5 TaxID=2965076 RepID=UPI0021046B5E|nr:Cas9 inhibitor AcrIIA9 family protein [Sporolactobacillus sp. STSJ-5]MCQ2009237.1 hypothetical protein [Sporolactobacillus sp. STSJ-5]
MPNRAIDKIKAEMDKEKNPYVQVIGQFLIGHLQVHPNDADKIADEKKTIMMSLKAMETEAQKKKVDNCGILTDAEGYEVVLKYFGIDGNPAVQEPANQEPTQKEQKSQADPFDVKLEDFM